RVDIDLPCRKRLMGEIATEIETSLHLQTGLLDRLRDYFAEDQLLGEILGAHRDPTARRAAPQKPAGEQRDERGTGCPGEPPRTAPPAGALLQRALDPTQGQIRAQRDERSGHSAGQDQEIV